MSGILAKYEAFVISRAKFLRTHTEDLLHASIGLSGEAGELLDCVKKTWVYNKPLDTVNVCEELGDALFYLQHAATLMGTSIEQLMWENMQKLEKRYPSGYTDQAAQERADKKELIEQFREIGE